VIVVSETDMPRATNFGNEINHGMEVASS